MAIARPRPGEALLAAGIRPIAPGVYLAERVLPHRGVTADQAADAMRISPGVFREILDQRRTVDGEIAEKLSGFTGLSPGFWLNMQAAFDLSVTSYRSA
jgi:addiction module HigA family antidote